MSTKASSPEPWTSNVFSSHSPSRRILEMIAGKWMFLLIHALDGRASRTAELKRRVGGISEKMLIQSLRELERYGFVNRQSHPEVPPRVEYSLTSIGESLCRKIQALDHWIEANAIGIEAARQEFDERQGKTA